MATAMRPYDRTGHSPLGGLWVAYCDACREVCAYWDEDDLDEYGTLWHECREADDSWTQYDPAPFSEAGRWWDDLLEREG